MKRIRFTVAFVLVAVLSALPALAAELSTAFTYQGRLTARGVAVNGLYDLRLTLYNASTGGDAIGTNTHLNVPVSNGLIMTNVDFGAGIFSNSNYWLKVELRASGSGSGDDGFSELTPRQRLAATPYALFAPNAGNAASAQTVPWNGLTGVPPSLADPGNVALLNAHQTFTGSNVFSGVLGATNPNNTLAGSFTGSGGGLTNLSAAALSGTVPDARLTANVALLSGSPSFAGTVGGSALQIAGGGAFGGDLSWGASGLTLDQCGAIELGDSLCNGTLPYIDFHFGTGASQDYNVRLINDLDGQLTLEGTFRVSGNLSYSGQLNKLNVGENLLATVRAADFRLGHSSRRGSPGRALVDFTDSLYVNYGSDWTNTCLGGTVTLDPDNMNNGSLTNGLRLGGLTSGEGIASQRTAGTNQYGLDFYTASQKRLSVLVDGRVGIGTTNPSTLLDVAGTVQAAAFSGSGSNLTAVDADLLDGFDTTASFSAASQIYVSGANGFLPAGTVDSGTILNGTISDADISPSAAIADTKLATITTAGKVADTAVSANVARLNTVGTITANWVNTDNPWADNEVADTLTISAGNINGTPIGQATPAAGAFTSLTANTVTAVGDLVGNRLNVGAGNSLSGMFASIAGGANNTNQASRATINGGDRNVISNNAQYATVAGGQRNTARASAVWASIGGGGSNTIDGIGATIGGGLQNTNSGASATIAGGERNNILSNANYATIVGGRYNTISNNADYATVAGGRSNAAWGPYSFAAGRQAKALHQGTFVWADATDADFASTADNQFLIRASGGVGIATPTVDVTGSANIASLFSLGKVTTSVGPGSTLTPTASYVALSASGATILNGVMAIADASRIGSMLILQGTSNVNTVQINNGANTRLVTTRVLGMWDTLMLIWDGTDWVELSFSDKP